MYVPPDVGSVVFHPPNKAVKSPFPNGIAPMNVVLPSSLVPGSFEGVVHIKLYEDREGRGAAKPVAVQIVRIPTVIIIRLERMDTIILY